MEDSRCGIKVNEKFEETLEKPKQAKETEGESLYKVAVGFETSEDVRTEKEYTFSKPKVGSYDRYVRALSKSPTKASRTFVMDNVVESQKSTLTEDLEQFPAIAITISDKLLSMLGLGDATLTKL